MASSVSTLGFMASTRRLGAAAGAAAAAATATRRLASATPMDRRHITAVSAVTLLTVSALYLNVSTSSSLVTSRTAANTSSAAIAASWTF